MRAYQRFPLAARSCRELALVGTHARGPSSDLSAPSTTHVDDALWAQLITRRLSERIPHYNDPFTMAKLLRRPTRVVCFYCNTQVDPKDPRNFRCSACGCWNRYDASGEIMSDEPAMHDEKMNARSFAKRGVSRSHRPPFRVATYDPGVASPRKDRLPTAYGQSLFCRTCQTNQMLISNLLSNYLPPPDVRSLTLLRTTFTNLVALRTTSTHSASRCSMSIENPSRRATHPCAQTAFPQLRRRSGNGTRWRAPARSAGS